MDVDTERVGTDDEHMDYEEDGESVRDHDGDEMMEGNAEPMDAEPIVSNDTRTPGLSNSPRIEATALLSSPKPAAFSKLLASGTIPEAEMTHDQENPSFSSRHESREPPLTATTHETASISLGIPTATSSGADSEDSSTTVHSLAGEMPAHMRALQAARDFDEDGEEYYDERPPLDIQNLPPIILNLPALGARILFAPLNDDRELKLPVWLRGRHEELGEASLSDVWAAIRAELAREGLAKSGEMVVAEKQMELKMGEVSCLRTESADIKDDVNLQSITFLDLLQLHHGCDLAIPVQLYISFEPNRFITRYNAISRELKSQDERRKSSVEVAETQLASTQHATRADSVQGDGEEDAQSGVEDQESHLDEHSVINARTRRSEEEVALERYGRRRGADGK